MKIIIPAFNESKTIGEVITNARIYGLVIVVDDASTDNTATVAKNSGALVLSNTYNLGYELSLIRGLKFAVEISDKSSEIIVSMDADGEHPADAIPMFEQTCKGSSLVIGRRNHLNRWSEYLGAWYASLCYGIPDPFCGMRAYNNKFLNQYLSSGFKYNLGLGPIVFAKLSKKQVVPHDIWVSTRVDKSRFGVGVTANLKLISSIIKDLCARYGFN